MQSQALINQVNGTPHCQKPLYPIFKARRSNGDERVTWRLFQSCWDETRTHLLVPFEVENSDSNPFRAIRNVIAMDKRDTRYTAHVAFMDEIARPAAMPTTQQTGETPVTDTDEPVGMDGQDESPADIAAEVGVEQTVRGVIAIRLDQAASINHLRIRLIEPHTDELGQTRYLEASVSQWSRHRPNVAPYTGDDWAREVAEQEAREARATQLILGPSVSAGACWLPDSRDETNLDSTDCFVFGMRVTKGITEMIAFEVEAIGGWTGDAAFDGQTRSARFGRVTGSGLLRFGQFTIPYFRLGVGAQGLGFSGQGPSSEFSGLTIVGGGLARRLGEQFITSVSVTTVTRGFDELRTFEPGIHLGYGWNP